MLNTSLHTHAQTLSLLALQRATPNFPPSLQFISPGRTLIKRELLWMLDHAAGAGPVRREILLFSDCLAWLEDNDGSGLAWLGKEPTTPTRTRTRSDVAVRSSPVNGVAHRASYHPPPSSSATPGSHDEKKSWIYRSHVGLVDVEVVGGVDVDPANQSDWKFDVLSPQGSFVLFAGGYSFRLIWSSCVFQRAYVGCFGPNFPCSFTGATLCVTAFPIFLLLCDGLFPVSLSFFAFLFTPNMFFALPLCLSFLDNSTILFYLK
jgi:FYVE/RhoGEF/PH domain-containing protein 5/6